MKNRPKLTLSSLVALVVAGLIMAYGSGDQKGVSNADTFEQRVNKKYNKGGEKRSDHTAGDFDYYTLVMSWSPTHCGTPEGRRDQTQCNRRDGRRYAFILHGVWPQYEKGYPEFCPIKGRPWVPNNIIDNMMDIMPSRGLIVHEYKKHGTCSGMSAKGYYALSRRFFKRINIPRRFQNPTDSQFMSPDDVVDEFTAANPGLKPSMIGVACRRGQGNRLREVRICFSKEGKLRACGGNERQRRLCRADRMHVPPVRSRS